MYEIKNEIHSPERSLLSTSNSEKSELEDKIDGLQLQLMRLEEAMRKTNQTNGNQVKDFQHTNIDRSQGSEDSFFEEPFVTLLAKVEDENIDLYNGHSSMYNCRPYKRRNFGLFSWKSLLLIDPCLNLVWEFANKKTPNPDTSKANTNELKDLLNSNTEQFKESIKVKGKEPLLQNVDSIKARMNAKANRLGLSVSDKHLETKLELLSKVELVLPNRTATWMFIDKFFTEFYPFFPFLDEEDFTSNIVRLIGDKNLPSETPISIEIAQKNDFAYLGILLIVVRLGYLTLFTPFHNGDGAKKNELNSDSSNPIAQQKEYLMNNPATIEIFDVAQDCLKQFELFGTINLTIFQLALYTKIYKTYSPEYGEGPDHGDSQVFSGVLFQLAYSLGLHRDPDNIPFDSTEKETNLGRKIWYGLLMMDLEQSLENGDPLNSNKFSFDTKLPYKKPGNSNLIDEKREEMVIECFQFLRSSYFPIVELLEGVLSLQSQKTISIICKQINYIKREVFGQKGLLETFNNTSKRSNKNELIINTFKNKIELQASYFFCSLYFYLFNALERKGNHKFAFYYLIRLFDKLLLVIVPFYCAFANNKVDLEPSIDFVLMPGIEQMIHKALLCLLSVLIRVKIMIINRKLTNDHTMKMVGDKQYQDNFNKLVKLYGLMISFSKTLLLLMSRYSNRYYYSWIISRLNRYFMSIVESDNFELSVYSQPMHFEVFNRNEYIDQLIEILEKSQDEMEAGTKYNAADISPTDNLNLLSFQDSLTGSSDGFFETDSSLGVEPPEYLFGSAQEIDSLWLHLRSMRDKQNPDPNNIDQMLRGQYANSPSTVVNGDDFVNSYVVDEIFKDVSF